MEGIGILWGALEQVVTILNTKIVELGELVTQAVQVIVK